MTFRVFRNPRSAELVCAFALAVFSFALYVRTLAPGILDGDSGEWQYMASILGVAHSTGYPLYLLLGKLFTLLPLGSPAWRVSLLSAVCAAVSVGVIYLLALSVSRSRIGAALAACLMALAPTLWASAVEAEVYALNTLLISLTLYFAVQWYRDGQPRDLFLTAFVFGLSLDNHRVAAFIAPGLLLLLWFTRKRLSLRQLAAAAIVFLVPLLLYAYIPVRASQLLADQSPANRELYPRAEAYLKGTVSAYYNHTPYGFFNLVTGFDNRNKLGFQSSASDALGTRIVNATDLLLQQFNPAALLLALAGLAFLWRRDSGLVLILLAGAAGVGAIALTLRAESTRFYFSGAYLVLALWAAVGTGEFIARIATRPFARTAAVLFLAVIPFYALVINYPQVDRSGDEEYECWARSVIADDLAPNAVVVAPWEIVTGLRYLQFVEGQRPDLLFVHESPIRPQFQKLLTAAHEQSRPFYYVQFTPEEKTATGPRTVQAVGMPLLSRPQPRYSLDLPLVDGVSLLGYDYELDAADRGRSVRLLLYYETLATPGSEYTAELSMSDIRGEEHGRWQRLPVSDYYPTYFWKAGDFYRDVWEIPLSTKDPRGLYNFELTWSPYDPQTNQTHIEQARSVVIGPLRIGDFAAGVAEQKQRAEFVNGMTLLGYSLTGNAERGKTLTLSLYWTAAQPIKGAYKTFVHFEDSGGIVRAQCDTSPWNGMFPTDRWLPGETVQDECALQIPADAPPGNYRLRVGVYERPDARVPLASGGDQVTLDTNITISDK